MKRKSIILILLIIILGSCKIKESNKIKIDNLSIKIPEYFTGSYSDTSGANYVDDTNNCKIYIRSVSGSNFKNIDEYANSINKDLEEEKINNVVWSYYIEENTYYYVTLYQDKLYFIDYESNNEVCNDYFYKIKKHLIFD